MSSVAHTLRLDQRSHRTVCPWKRTASYFDMIVDGERNRDAAWYYPQTSRAAGRIRDYVAFWHGMKVRPAERA